MSLVIVIRRPNFTVLGADRLASPIEESSSEESKYAEQTKVGVHPDLPIAWASWGIASLDSRSMTSVVGEMIMDVPEDLWERPGIALEIVRLRLDPLVNAQRLQAPERHRSQVRVEVVVAIGLGRMRVELIGQEGITYVPRALVKSTPHLEGFFDSTEMAEELRFGSPDETRDKTVGRVKQMIKQGIAEEAKQSRGKLLKCGFGGDIAVVDGTVARIVEHFKMPLATQT